MGARFRWTVVSSYSRLMLAHLTSYGDRLNALPADVELGGAFCRTMTSLMLCSV